MTESIKLTQYSHGAGCGCKISPKLLDQILSSVSKQQLFPQLLVGNETKDDAAVYDIGNGRAIISTTDFFMPIVDDPEQFGTIASVNAISDIYAMGGTPIMAIAILGWPIDKVESKYASEVLEGARKACAQANIPLAGGHSIDCPEPVFGLAVTGIIDIENLKKNSGASVGCSLYLTKKIGVGILTTAQKKNLLKEEHKTIAPDSMMHLNTFGEILGKQNFVEAMTDVTGFGLLGHLTEMCEGSNVSAEIYFDKVPTIDKEILDYYLENKCIPGGTNRNHDSYGEKIDGLDIYKKHILCDPQTSGGLLVAIAQGYESDFEKLAKENKMQLTTFGKLISKSAFAVYVK
ncbi:MAG: selenide, water dikinase SelD [Chitinophagales bacterium]|nr:selenide, water dikinase SelD [Bacteroidota bacterium]MBP7399436.1 selenide, water dikinase SelD [Chitinophagales bacterium]MBP9704045.1 selenide, water dikinase SelD [Chitinophagales bacterium]